MYLIFKLLKIYHKFVDEGSFANLWIMWIMNKFYELWIKSYWNIETSNFIPNIFFYIISYWKKFVTL